MTYIKILLRGTKYKINGDNICEILGILVVGAWVYDSEMWP